MQSRNYAFIFSDETHRRLDAIPILDFRQTLCFSCTKTPPSVSHVAEVETDNQLSGGLSPFWTFLYEDGQTVRHLGSSEPQGRATAPRNTAKRPIVLYIVDFL